MSGSRNLGGRKGFLSHLRGNAAKGGVSIGDDATTVIAFHGVTGDVQRTYTVTNPPAATRSLDGSTTVANDVAKTLATLIADLKAKGLIG